MSVSSYARYEAAINAGRRPDECDCPEDEREEHGYGPIITAAKPTDPEQYDWNACTECGAHEYTKEFTPLLRIPMYRCVACGELAIEIGEQS